MKTTYGDVGEYSVGRLALSPSVITPAQDRTVISEANGVLVAGIKTGEYSTRDVTDTFVSIAPASDGTILMQPDCVVISTCSDLDESGSTIVAVTFPTHHCSIAVDMVTPKFEAASVAPVRTSARYLRVIFKGNI